MIFKNSTPQAMRGIVFTSLLTLLSSCGNSSALESLVAPDPQLNEGKTEQVANRTKSSPNKSPSPQNSQPNAETDTFTTKPNSPNGERQNQQSNKGSKGKRERNNQGAEVAQANKTNDLLLNFPDTFPVYPQAQLQKMDANEAKNSGTIVWQTRDNRQAVADYYQAELLADDWDIIKPFNLNPKQKISRAIAVKEELRVELSLTSTADKQPPDETQLAIVYSSVEDIPKSSISRSVEPEEKTPANLPASATEKTARRQSPSGEKTQPEGSKANGAIKNNQQYLPETNVEFTDLDLVPEQLQQPLESVAALGILTPYTAKANVELGKFAPNETITRGEFARWLIAANNRYYADNPGKKIYVAAKSNESAFNDVKPEHTDFAAIQSLAEAGLIPSRLTEDSTNILFRPDAPLTRENLVTWKVPLDTRQSLPKASIEAIEESWGFQDATEIDSAAVRALYADYQNGDRSNVRRMFGYTTLFQPNKSVTRAEAAASLWYFGYQGDGITAKEALESETEAES